MYRNAIVRIGVKRLNACCKFTLVYQCNYSEMGIHCCDKLTVQTSKTQFESFEGGTMFLSWWGGNDVIVCESGVHKNLNLKTHRAVIYLIILSTLGPGFTKVSFRPLKTPDPSGRLAQTHKTGVFTKKSVWTGP